jgi:hypothetical protein
MRLFRSGGRVVIDYDNTADDTAHSANNRGGGVNRITHVTLLRKARLERTRERVP